MKWSELVGQDSESLETQHTIGQNAGQDDKSTDSAGMTQSQNTVAQRQTRYQARYYDNDICSFCSGSHRSSACSKRQAQHSCFLCGSSQHSLDTCHLNRCYVCGQRHTRCSDLVNLKNRYHKQCFRCGAESHIACMCMKSNSKRNATRDNKLCVFCGITGHFVWECRSLHGQNRGTEPLLFGQQQRPQIVDKVYNEKGTDLKVGRIHIQRQQSSRFQNRLVMAYNRFKK